MNIHRIAFLIVVALISPAAGVAQKASSPRVPFVRVRWSDTTLHITYQGKKIDHDFRESEPDQDGPEYRKFQPGGIGRVKTERLLQKNGQVFMLLDVQGSSRGPEAAGGYCGAGEEKALVMFHMDSDGLLEEPQVLTYESCLYTIGSPDDSSNEGSSPALSSRQALVKVFSFTRMRGLADPKDFAVNRDMVTVEVQFDPGHPELGLVAKEKAEDYKTAIR